MWYRTDYNDPKVRDIEEMKMMCVYWCLSVEQSVEEAESKSPSSWEKNKVVLVIDRTNNVLDMPFLKAVIPFLQEHLPLRIHKIIVTPSNFLLRGIVNLVWPLLSAELRSVLVVLPDCPDLREYMTEDNIPVRMEGKDTYEFNGKDPETWPQVKPA